jgi:uncharacterized protein (TIGR00251 family)
LQSDKFNEELLDAIHQTDDGVILDIIVQPLSKSSGLVGFNKWRRRFEIKVRAPPSKGKANDEVIIILADYFGLDHSDVIIISGLKSVQKKVILKSIIIQKVIQKLEAIPK